MDKLFFSLLTILRARTKVGAATTAAATLPASIVINPEAIQSISVAFGFGDIQQPYLLFIQAGLTLLSAGLYMYCGAPGQPTAAESGQLK